MSAMKILVVGGSGEVGSLVLPLLAQQHALRVFDLKPPVDPTWEYVRGDVLDLASISAAMQNIDALIYMAMGLKDFPQNPIGDRIRSNFDVNVTGLYHALLAAQQAKVRSIVYTSTLSIYGWETDIECRYFTTEELPPAPRDAYSLTKNLGEEVCRHAARSWGLNINVLRLCWPRSIEDWQAQAYRGTPTLKTSADDLARALLAAVEFQRGFQLFNISGDYQQQFMNMTKAKRLLSWEPLARPQIDRSPQADRIKLKRRLRHGLTHFSRALQRQVLTRPIGLLIADVLARWPRTTS
jgi:nucleoside-diphosphate-sugar epimerase